jgi:small GTP-binding protein
MISQKDYDYLFKMILIGDAGAGKTCLSYRYVDNTWTDAYIATIGIDFKIKIFDLDEKKVKLQIFDTAGQERFRKITAAYYKSVAGIVLVYDITEIESFNNLNNWIEEIEKNASKDVCKILVGTKSDMEDKRQVSYEQENEFAEKLGMKFFETSAKASQNVEEVFVALTKEMILQRVEKEKAEAEAKSEEMKNKTQNTENTENIEEFENSESLI